MSSRSSGVASGDDGNSTAGPLQFDSDFECGNLKQAALLESIYNGYHMEPGAKYEHFGERAERVAFEYRLQVHDP